MRFRRVDFPEPLRPRRATVSPGGFRRRDPGTRPARLPPPGSSSSARAVPRGVYPRLPPYVSPSSSPILTMISLRRNGGIVHGGLYWAERKGGSGSAVTGEQGPELHGFPFDRFRVGPPAVAQYRRGEGRHLANPHAGIFRNRDRFHRVRGRGDEGDDLPVAGTRILQDGCGHGDRSGSRRVRARSSPPWRSPRCSRNIGEQAAESSLRASFHGPDTVVSATRYRRTPGPRTRRFS